MTDSESWRDRILREHADQLEDWWQEISNEPVMSDEEFERDAVRRFDPKAEIRRCKSPVTGPRHDP